MFFHGRREMFINARRRAREKKKQHRAIMKNTDAGVTSGARTRFAISIRR
jgi:hypothetical protein